MKPLIGAPTPLPRRRPGLRQRLARSVEARARARPLNRRGTVRPQRGLEYLCARLIERGFVKPPADLGLMREQLVERGIARPFGAPLVVGSRTAWHEPEDAAEQVRDLLGWTRQARSSADSAGA